MKSVFSVCLKYYNKRTPSIFTVYFSACCGSDPSVPVGDSDFMHGGNSDREVHWTARKSVDLYAL